MKRFENSSRMFRRSICPLLQGGAGVGRAASSMKAREDLAGPKCTRFINRG